MRIPRHGRKGAAALVWVLTASCAAWPYLELGGGTVEGGQNYGEARAGVVLTQQASEPARQPAHALDEPGDGPQGQPGPGASTGAHRPSDGWVDADAFVPVQGAPDSPAPGACAHGDTCAQLAAAIADLTRALAPAQDPDGAPGGGAAQPAAPAADEALHLTTRVTALERAVEVLVAAVDHDHPGIATDVQAATGAEGDFDLTDPAAIRAEVDAWSWGNVGMVAVLGLLGLAGYAAVRAVNRYLGKGA